MNHCFLINFQKEELSRNKGVKQNKSDKEERVTKTEEYETLVDDDIDAIKQIADFENKLGTQDSDTD